MQFSVQAIYSTDIMNCLQFVKKKMFVFLLNIKKRTKENGQRCIGQYNIVV